MEEFLVHSTRQKGIVPPKATIKFQPSAKSRRPPFKKVTNIVNEDAEFFMSAPSQFDREWRNIVKELGAEETYSSAGQNLIDTIYQMLSDESIYS